MNRIYWMMPAGCLLFLLRLNDARALELDTLLPTAIPGYGVQFGVIDDYQMRRADDSSGFDSGAVRIDPSIDLDYGYDSAPNGASGGSVTLQEVPSLLVADRQMGLALYLQGNFTQLPENPSQNLSGYVLALGEQIVLPRETITAAAAYLQTQETGFALITQASNVPEPVATGDVRVSDKIVCGLFTVTPQASATNFRFGTQPAGNRTDTREALTTAYAPGGPGQIVLRFQATQSIYTDAVFNSDTNEILAGAEDHADGLWNIRLLAGAARRQSSLGGGLTAPVVEASLDWMPGDLDRLSLTLSREIDDPDEISAAPYTLTQVKFTLTHEYLRNLILNGTATAAHADYLQGNRQETLFETDASASWRLNAQLALTAEYAFWDRQTNFLNAANEHVVTIGVSWSP